MIRWRTAIVGALAVCAVLFSGAAQAQDTARITGRVMDRSNNIYMSGVTVTTQDGRFKTVTSRDGSYELSVSPGGHTLNFSAMGYEAISREVEVPVGVPVRVDVEFGSAAMALDEVVVTGQAVGQAKALNRQMNSDAVVNVVSSDAFGRFPDQNAAEALRRLPGMAVENDQGEGRFVVVRGINPELNSASVDGMALTSPDSDARAVLLDVIPMNVMETLVVTKTLTPDMPADSIGGHIGIETPSAFDRTERTLQGSVGGNYADLTGEFGPNAQFTYGEVFGDKQQFGILASLSYDKRNLGSDNVEAETWEKDDAGHWVTDELQYREYDLSRERIGFTSNLEYRPSNNSKFYLHGLYCRFTDHEIRRRTVIDDMQMLSDAGGNTGMLVNEDDQNESPDTTVLLKDREETQSNLAISLGGDHKINSWTLDYKVGYSYAEQDTPYDYEFSWNTDSISYAYWNADSDTPRVAALNQDLDDLGLYEFDEVSDSSQIVKEKAWIFGANIKKELKTVCPAYIKTGFLATLRNKQSDLETWVSDSNPDSFDTLEGNTSSGRNTYADFPLVSEDIADKYETNRSDFDMERDLVDSYAEDYETDENVLAGYIMGNLEFGRVNLIGGVRVEHTRLESTGYVIDEAADNPVQGQESKDHDYTNILPGILGRVAITDDLILNAAWTNTISRPLWDQTRYARVTDDDGDVEVGNPELDPYESMNWDLTLAYYIRPVGVVSVGVFYKNIDNFIYPLTVEEDDYDLTTWHNGGDGDILGLELAYQQKLTFLPSPLDGLSLLANITISDSSADVPASEDAEERTVDLVRHSGTVGSVALSYEKYGFFIRLSGTYRTSYLDELGEEPSEDHYIDDHFQVDISSSYDITEHFTIYAQLLNLTNEPLKAYWGESGRLSQYEEYGMAARAGVKFTF